MSQTPIYEVTQKSGKKDKRCLLWYALLSSLFIVGTISANTSLLGSASPGILLPALATVVAWGLSAATAFVKRKKIAIAIAAAFPVLLFLVLGPANIVSGTRYVINCIISAWNAAHNGGIPLLGGEMSQVGISAFAIFVSAVTGIIFWYLVSGRHIFLCGLAGLLLLVIQLLCNTFSVWSCVMWFSAFIGLWVSHLWETPSPRTLVTTALCAVILSGCAFFIPENKIDSVTDFRNSVEDEIQTIRYGEDPFPQGNVFRADVLNSSSDNMLTVHTEYEKSLYLRAFVGSAYSDGIWSPFYDSAYAGKYSGMLKWLSEKGFDPITQPSLYFSLTEKAPEENRVSINVSGAARCYIYAPSTASGVKTEKVSEKNDERFLSKNLFGSNFYTVGEISSSSRPAEITVREDWVENPETEEQKNYAEAEAVYRSFVYENYTAINSEIKELVDRLFWENYSPEQDGIFSAVCRIRNVLEKITSDGEKTENEEPLVSFLNGKTKGNSVLYATAAVEALRSRGIPARYVEGYYVSAYDIVESRGGNVTVTGQNAHAWAEVYFDGVGWLPVEFTQGYYYDAVTLQQMVASPDIAKKTAVINDSSSDVGEIAAGHNSAEKPRSEPLEVMKNAGLMLLGFIAFLLTLVAAGFVIAEILRGLFSGYRNHLYKKASPEEKVRMLSDMIFTALYLRDIDACLGWKVDETDEIISATVDGVKPDEYKRIVAIIEKTVYGGKAPDGFELRNLVSFTEKVAAVDGNIFSVRFLKTRYGYICSVL